MDTGSTRNAASEVGTDAMPGTLKLEIAFGDNTFSSSGDGELVLRAFAEFKQHVLDTSPRTAGRQGAWTPPRADGQVNGDNEGREPAEISAESQPLPIFLNNCALKGNAELAVGIAAWAKRYKGHEEVEPEMMQGFWRMSGRKIPSNIPRDMRVAAKEGWLEHVGGRKYALTAYGEKLVDERYATAG